MKINQLFLVPPSRPRLGTHGYTVHQKTDLADLIATSGIVGGTGGDNATVKVPRAASLLCPALLSKTDARGGHAQA